MQRANSKAAGEEIRATFRKLFAYPREVDNAVQVALLDTRGVLAIYLELGIAEGDFVYPITLPQVTKRKQRRLAATLRK